MTSAEIIIESGLSINELDRGINSMQMTMIKRQDKSMSQILHYHANYVYSFLVFVIALHPDVIYIRDAHNYDCSEFN